jgi:regulatory protein YycH of two-component signal transduction system YycFG
LEKVKFFLDKHSEATSEEYETISGKKLDFKANKAKSAHFPFPINEKEDSFAWNHRKSFKKHNEFILKSVKTMNFINITFSEPSTILFNSKGFSSCVKI